MDLTVFSHGQTKSKIWLCQHLEPHIPYNANIAILGCWYNMLSFMLLSRNENICNKIIGIDIDPSIKPIADKLNDAWTCGPSPKIQHVITDANFYNLDEFDLIINCSPEHMNSDDWFHNINEGTLVCIQSSDIDIQNDNIWKCINPNKSIEELSKKYPLSTIIYSDTLRIQYSDWGYNRFMLIGIK